MVTVYNSLMIFVLRMEGNDIMEEHCERSESTLVSKSIRPVIDSRSLEVVSDNEKQEESKCGHFSIRGYVAEIRRKDRNICWPFHSVGNHNESEEQTEMLPPLHLSEFRWWGCQNCLRKTSATTAATDVGVISNCYNTGFKSNNTGSRGKIFISSHGDAPMFLSGFPQAPEKNITGERKTDANTSVDLNGGVYCSSLSSEKKKKEVEGVHAIREDMCKSGDYGNSAEGNMNQANPIPTWGAKKVNPCLTGERITKDVGKFSGSSKADKHGRNLSACETAVASEFMCPYKNASEQTTLRLKGTGLIEFCGPNCESHEVSDVGFDIRNLKCVSNSSTGICQKAKPGFNRNDFVKMNEQHREVTKYCGTSEVLGTGNEALNAVTGDTRKLYSLESDKNDYGFSDNGEKLVGNNLHDQHHACHHGNSGGALHQRKTQKVRLLTDIISSEVLGASSKNRSSNGNANTDHIKTEVGPSKATPNVSAGIGLLAVPKSQVVVQGNVRKGIPGIKKERKMPPDEEWGPLQIRWPKSVAEKGRISKGDAETNHIDTASSNYVSAEDALAGIGLSTGFNSHLTKHRFGRKLIKDEKKNKKPRLEDGRSSLMPWQEGTSSEVQVIRRDVEIKCTGVETVVSKSAQEEFMGRGMYTFLESYVSAQKNDRKSISCKKKSKMPQVEDGWASLNPWQEGMSREDQIIPFKSTPDALPGIGVDHGLKIKKAIHRKAIVSKKQSKMPQVQGGGCLMPQDVEFKPTGAETAPFKSAQGAFIGRGLHPSLKKFVTAQINDKKSVLCKKKSEVPQVEDGWGSITSWKDGMSKEDRIIKEDVEIKPFGASRVPFKSASDAFSGRCEHLCLNSKKATNRKAIVRKKQTSMPRVEGRGSFLMQSKDFSSTCNYEKTIDVQGHLEVIKNQCDQRANKVCEQATLDDIPMEIVELMAKNQYERRLLDVEDATKNKSCLSETTNNMKTDATIDLTEALGNEMLRLLQEKNSHMRKIHPSNAGSGLLTTDKSVRSTVGYSSHVNRKYEHNDFSISQPEESHASTWFPTFYQCQEKLSCEGQFAVTGSSRNCGSRNRRWNGDMVGHRCSPTCLHSLEAYRTCQNVSPQRSCKEAHQVWSLMKPNSMPFDINNPQKFVTESSNIELLPQCPDSLRRGNMDGDHGLKSLNPNAANLQNQNGMFDDETLKRTHAEYPQKENEYHPKLMGPLDLYTNESIPAMHLLRLMDAGMCSSTPVSVDENQKFPKQPSFPHNHHCKKFSGVEIGVSEICKASTHPPPDYFGKNHRLGISCEHSPLVTTVDAIASSVRKDGKRRASGFTGQVLAKMRPHSLKSQGKAKTKISCSPTQTRGPRSHRPVSASGSSRNNHEPVPFHDLQKGFLSASDSMEFPLQSNSVEDLITQVELEVNKKDGKVGPVKNSCRTEICAINRNPADFTLPEAGNEYMIGGEELKHRKMIPSWDRLGLINTDGHKRQKMMKLAAIQEHVRH
ncbi:hypothetical protein HHK36_014122 [Tetracentron sinense]|uniref:Uncharacterized protein n=1 Tax=Tetracentron sinense TaxID=13715 RepID=A0A834Z5G9_TETSI|nr:hypothetical protein HHK36_014122 [Tetracentron sinense]